jgi:nucleoside-diphosphate-sugar epimerase
MKILVTGGLGFIGHNVVSLLESQGHTCIVTDTQTTYGIISQDELDYLICERRRKIKTDRIYSIDIADQAGIEWLISKHRPETIIHLASFPRQKVVNANPQLASRAMSEGLLNLLESAKLHQVCKFIYVSSSMVYGNFENNVTEDVACNPQGQYGIMKLAGEWLVRDYARRAGVSHVIIRPSAVYGPLDINDRVVSKFMLTAMSDGVLKVNGADETLDFTYVDDVAIGIASVLLGDCNGIYNIARGQGCTLLEAAQLTVKIVGQGTIEILDKDTEFPTRGSLSIGAAQQNFGFNPQIDIVDGFQRYYDWLSNSKYWKKHIER